MEVFNITLLDFDNLFKGDSLVGLIGISASICAVLILLIFKVAGFPLVIVYYILISIIFQKQLT